MDKEKHDLLKILYNKRIDYENENPPPNPKVVLGLELNQIKEKIDLTDLNGVLSELLLSKEIEKFASEDFCSFFITDDYGYNAFHNKKYLIRQRNTIWKNVINWTQTFVPVLSLIATCLIIFLDSKKEENYLTKEDSRLLKVKIEQTVQKKVDSIFAIKNHPQIHKSSDTIKTVKQKDKQ